MLNHFYNFDLDHSNDFKIFYTIIIIKYASICYFLPLFFNKFIILCRNC